MVTPTKPPAVTLKAGHVRPVWAGHPWVFAQAVASVEAGVEAGDEVTVLDPRGRALGRGLYSPRSAIAVRLYTRDAEQPIDQALFRAGIARAADWRRVLGLPDERSDGYRVVNGEGDDLPGLIVDRFGDTLAVQIGSVGLKKREGELVAALMDALAPRALLDRTPVSTAQQEGFIAESGRWLAGDAADTLRFQERGFSWELPLALGQKTGFYFDQRPLRTRVEELARGKRVLDACTYVGAVAFSAARGGASEVLGIDKSRPAVEIALDSAKRLGFADVTRFEVDDASSALTRAAAAGGYDLVVVDPPKLAPRRGDRERALEAYRKLAGDSAAATVDGGLLAFCCCSGAIDLESLMRAVALGARERGRRATVLERYFQGPDHPVPAAFPEGLYLKVLLCRVERESAWSDVAAARPSQAGPEERT